MYEATFRVVTNKAKELAQVFAAEDGELSNNRGSYSLQARDNAVEITATASDATAFRAIVNAITKILAIFDKMQQV